MFRAILNTIFCTLMWFSRHSTSGWNFTCHMCGQSCSYSAPWSLWLLRRAKTVVQAS